MTLYHVTSYKKLQRYMEHGCIFPPVRAWKSIDAAERFSKQTGRRVVVRLKSDDTFRTLEGHRGEALVSGNVYRLEDV